MSPSIKKNGKGQKFALIHMGTDEVYGLEFVATEIKRHGQQIRWFDGDLEAAADEVIDWQAEFMCFSPLTTYLHPALDFSRKVKSWRPGTQSIFGGHHVTAVPETCELDGIDKIVVGPVYGTIEKIIEGVSKKVLRGQPVPVDMMTPARREYFEAVPNIGNRHKKTIMTHFGCPYKCSYCSTSRLKAEFGWKEYSKYWLTRRPIDHIIEEAKIFLEFSTKEVALEDDDMLYGKEIDEWLPKFAAAWKQNIGLPIIGNVTPNTVVKVSGQTLDTMAELVTVAQMGVQASRKETLKLFNRQFQNEKQVADAVERLRKRGIPVKLELIVGAPVDDPVGDAIETIKLAQRVGAGMFVAAFPLMLYPGTALQKWCLENNVAIRDDCTYECYGGVGSIRFDPVIQKKITNISKLAAFFVKYDVEERWMRTLIEMDLNDTAARRIAESTYYESLRFKLGDQIDQEFDQILANTKFRY
ncbi:MAG: B12-binding domain-containing radical SAM protein [Desulfobacterales bacterium]